MEEGRLCLLFYEQMCGEPGDSHLCPMQGIGKGGESVDKVWEKPGTAHPSPRQGIGRVGKVWTKCGRSQAIPTLIPCKT